MYKHINVYIYLFIASNSLAYKMCLHVSACVCVKYVCVYIYTYIQAPRHFNATLTPEPLNPSTQIPTRGFKSKDLIS